MNLSVEPGTGIRADGNRLLESGWDRDKFPFPKNPLQREAIQKTIKLILHLTIMVMETLKVSTGLTLMASDFQTEATK